MSDPSPSRNNVIAFCPDQRPYRRPRLSPEAERRFGELSEIDRRTIEGLIETFATRPESPDPEAR